MDPACHVDPLLSPPLKILSSQRHRSTYCPCGTSLSKDPSVAHDQANIQASVQSSSVLRDDRLVLRHEGYIKLDVNSTKLSLVTISDLNVSACIQSSKYFCARDNLACGTHNRINLHSCVGGTSLSTPIPIC